MNYRGKEGNIHMTVQRKVTPRWADDPMWRHDGPRWRGFWGRRVIPPPEGHQEVERKGGAGQV